MVRMAAERKRSWLLLEWIGTTLFGVLPDIRPVNAFLARVFYFFFNKYRFPNLSAPRHFNEKLIALKLSREARAPLRARLTDKEHVKRHVANLLGPAYAPPTLAVLHGAVEVDSFVFPLPCVVKPTHSSQEVMLLEDGQPDERQRRILKYWLRKSYFAANREPNYRFLKKKLIVEPVLGGVFGAVDDIKVLCFHGRPKLIQVDHGRFAEHRRDYFDLSGDLLPISMRKARAGRPFPCPEKLPDILAAAARLSAGFSFMRVDFYVVDGQTLVGEMTSFPTNCTIPFQPASADLYIARLFDEPELEVTRAALVAAEEDAARRPDPAAVPAPAGGPAFGAPAVAMAAGTAGRDDLFARFFDAVRAAGADPVVRKTLAVGHWVLLAGVVSLLAWKLAHLGWRDVLRSLPTAPWFYVFFLLRYLTLPIAETAAYEVIWRRSLARRFAAFLRKRVYNSAVAGYSGEGFLTLWARRRLGLSGREALVGVKDNNILSALTANVATIALLASLLATGQLSKAVALVPAGPWLFGFAFTAAAVMTIAVVAFRSRLVALPADRRRRVLAIHAARQIVNLALFAAMYEAALPVTTLAAWSAFIGLQFVISRIPFLPNQDIVYLTAALSLAPLVGAPPQALAGMLIAEAALSLSLGAGLFIATANVARLEPAPAAAAPRRDGS